MPSYNNNFLVVDCETGGLPSRLKKEATTEVALTEIAMSIIDNEKLEIVESKSWLFKPYSDDLIYDPQALQVTGITIDMLEKNGLEMKTAMKEIQDFCKKARAKTKKPYLVGHNIIKFDLDFIENLWEFNGKDISKDIDTGRVYDTLDIARDKWVTKPGFKLIDVAGYLGIDLIDAHRAESDTIVTAKIFIEFMKLLRGSSEHKEENEEEILTPARYREEFYL